MKKGNKLPHEKQEEISVRLKGLRNAAGFTQKEISKKLNITIKTYRSWEVGIYDGKTKSTSYPLITYDDLSLLADIYHVSVDYILGRTRSDHSMPPEKYIDYLSSLSDTEILAIQQIKASAARTDKVVTPSEMLEYTLSSGMMYDFLDDLGKYCDMGYDTPLTWNKESRKYTPTYDPSDSPNSISMTAGQKHITVGREMLDNAGNPGYSILSFPIGRLSDLWLTGMQSIIFEWKRMYLEKRKKK